jgi:hypothetical protein
VLALQSLMAVEEWLATSQAEEIADGMEKRRGVLQQ